MSTAMDNPETTAQKFTSASRWTFLSTIASMCLFAAIVNATAYLESRWVWLLDWRWLLEDIARAFLMYTFLGFVASLMIPGLLIFPFPGLAHAWLRGVNPAVFSYKPWNQLSNLEAFGELLSAMLYFVFGVLMLRELIINGWFGQTMASIITTK